MTLEEELARRLSEVMDELERAEQDAARLAALLVDVRSYVLEWHKTREHMDGDIRRALAAHEERVGGAR